jgi:hypothetical protein
MDMEGQQDRELGQSGTAFELDQAVVTADEVLRDRETEPGAIGTAGHERIEQGFAQMVGTPGPLSSNCTLATSRCRRAPMLTLVSARVRSTTRPLPLVFCAIAAARCDRGSASPG